MSFDLGGQLGQQEIERRGDLGVGVDDVPDPFQAVVIDDHPVGGELVAEEALAETRQPDREAQRGQGGDQEQGIGESASLAAPPAPMRQSLLRPRSSPPRRQSSLEERSAAVLAEDVAQRAAGLADRGSGAQRLADRVEQVDLAPGGVAKLLEPGLDRGIVARALNSASRFSWWSSEA